MDRREQRLSDRCSDRRCHRHRAGDGGFRRTRPPIRAHDLRRTRRRHRHRARDDNLEDGGPAPGHDPSDAPPRNSPSGRAGSALAGRAVAADLDDLRAVLRRGFAEDEEERDVIDSLFNGPEAIGGPAVDAVLAMLGGRPIACAMVYRVGDEAVVGWVATVPEARNRGLGGRLTMAVTNRGFDLGATLVTLQASPMGAPVYARLGYETIMPSRIWVGPKRL